MAQFCSELILLVIFTQFLLSSSNYIYQDISGSLINNSGFNFSIYSTDLTGIILYGGDSGGNKLLIQIDKVNNEKIIQLKMNKYERYEKIKTICECSECSNVVMIFVMQLNGAQINITCNDKLNILQMDATNNQDVFSDYPKLKQQSNDKNETFIMMGNIGLIEDSRSIIFKPLNNQLIGCLHQFYYDNKLINFSQNETKFNYSCNEEYKEIICKDGNCTNRNVLYSFDDCSISSMNSKYCRNNLSTFPSNENKYYYYYKIKGNISENFFRLNWQILQPNQYCLLEIKLKNETFILFHINKNGQILINIKYQQSIINEKILTNISITGINILLINFDYPNFIIKISNGENIYTFIDKFMDDPISINVGMSKYFNICQQFFGRLEVKYDSKYWQVPAEQKTIGLYITIIIVILLFNLLILGLLFLYFVRSRLTNRNKQRARVENQHYQIEDIKNISMPLHMEREHFENTDEYGCIRD